MRIIYGKITKIRKPNGRCLYEIYERKYKIGTFKTFRAAYNALCKNGG